MRSGLLHRGPCADPPFLWSDHCTWWTLWTLWNLVQTKGKAHRWVYYIQIHGTSEWWWSKRCGCLWQNKAMIIWNRFGLNSLFLKQYQVWRTSTGTSLETEHSGSRRTDTGFESGNKMKVLCVCCLFTAPPNPEPQKTPDLSSNPWPYLTLALTPP